MSAEQYPLPGEWPEPSAREQSIQAAFERFHADHPEVFAEFKSIAYRLLDAGRDHYSSKAILEIIRYHRALSIQDEREPFRLNNNYSSRYSRLLVDEEPRFAEWFEFRVLKAA